MGPLVDLIGSNQFQAGLVAGLVTFVIGAIFASELRARGRRVPGVVGPLWVAACLAALSGWFWLPKVVNLPWAVPVGLALLFAGGELSTGLFPESSRRFPFLPAVVAAVPGASMVAWSAHLNRAGWTPWFIFLATVLGGVLVADFDSRTTRLGIAPWLWVISIGGMYANLADTELVLVLLGASIPLALLGWPLRIGRLGSGGSSAAVALFVWVIAFEAPAKPLQVWLLFGLFGLLVLEPLGRLFGTPRKHGLSDGIGQTALRLILVVVDAAIVMYVARVVGFSERFPGDSWRPLMLLVPALVIGMLLSHYLWLGSKQRLRGRPKASSHRVVQPDVRATNGRSRVRRSAGSSRA